jgi:exosome complex component RRP41
LNKPACDRYDMSELSFLSVATVGGVEREEDKVSVLVMESRLQIGGASNKLEGMLAVGVDGCKQVRGLMEGVIRQHGAKIMRGRR